MRLHDLAGDSGQCRQSEARKHRIRARGRLNPLLPSSHGLVGAVLGTNRLHIRRLWLRVLPHRRLRVGSRRVQRSRCRPTGHTSRVHPWNRGAGLLRRQPRRRLQPPDGG
ncbi:unnamed protein product [Linum tenue]|uniref:Uncharacterized protein n=1 Tax=Linum tenue TaxID=586396 RepID=A0AAV0MG38_9ROSI|nr:unnamed protein product [Linum tenue]